jgi:hypothetical protein
LGIDEGLHVQELPTEGWFIIFISTPMAATTWSSLWLSARALPHINEAGKQRQFIERDLCDHRTA